jgi:hypothetical protein
MVRQDSSPSKPLSLSFSLPRFFSLSRDGARRKRLVASRSSLILEHHRFLCTPHALTWGPWLTLSSSLPLPLPLLPHPASRFSLSTIRLPTVPLLALPVAVLVRPAAPCPPRREGMSLGLLGEHPFLWRPRQALGRRHRRLADAIHPVGKAWTVAFGLEHRLSDTVRTP